MRVLAIVPARYASTRFPGKPLAMLGGQTIIARVWKALSAMRCIDNVVVATDDERICAEVNRVAGREAAMMTSDKHRSGTDRCGEVLQKLEATGDSYDVVINVQGDEPFVDAAQIEALIGSFEKPQTDIATLKTPILSTDELFSPNNVKVVCDNNDNALYFSRQAIPFRRDVSQERWLDEGRYYKHVGIYAFRSNILHDVCALPLDGLETAEKLEQLRWLANGYRIAVCTTDHANIGIDTPEDLAAAEQKLSKGQVK